MLNFSKAEFYHETYDFGRLIRLMVRTYPDPANAAVHDMNCMTTREDHPSIRAVQILDEAPIFYEGSVKDFIPAVNRMLTAFEPHVAPESMKQLDAAWARFLQRWNSMQPGAPRDEKLPLAEPVQDLDT